MIKNKNAQLCVVCSVVLICGSPVIAQVAAGTPPATGAQAPRVAMLTRTQWLNKIGQAATDPKVAKEVMKQIPAEQKVEFTQRLITAITRLPVSPEVKLSLLVNSVNSCIGSTSVENNGRYTVIAEVMAVVPVEYLPGLVPEVAKTFTPQANNLTPAAFSQIATEVVKLSVERNTTAEDPSVRNAFVALLFLGATTPQETPGLQALLVTSMPETTRELTNNFISQGQEGNFQPMLTAADAGPAVIAPPQGDAPSGATTQSDALSGDTTQSDAPSGDTTQSDAPTGGTTGGLTGSFAEVVEGTIGGSDGSSGTMPDAGIDTVPEPLPYPNQMDIL